MRMRRRPPPYKQVFNAAVYALSVTTTAGSFRALARSSVTKKVSAAVLLLSVAPTVPFGRRPSVRAERTNREGPKMTAPRTSQLSPELRRLLDQRDRLARAATEAAAHLDVDADELRECQRQLEERLEALLPTPVWRQLFPRWVQQQLQADSRPAHVGGVSRRECSRCRATPAASFPLPRSA